MLPKELCVQFGVSEINRKQVKELEDRSDLLEESFSKKTSITADISLTSGNMPSLPGQMSEEMTGNISQSKETTESDLYMRDSPVRGRPVNKNKVKVISKMGNPARLNHA